MWGDLQADTYPPTQQRKKLCRQGVPELIHMRGMCSPCVSFVIFPPRAARSLPLPTRRMVELPVIQEGVSTPRGPTGRKASGSRRAPAAASAAGGSKRHSGGTVEREISCLFARSLSKVLLSLSSPCEGKRAKFYIFSCLVVSNWNPTWG